jgi:hypothetical protein
MTPTAQAALEDQIAHWRAYLQRRQAIHAIDVAELEDHLREQVATLSASGLAPDEAFLVAVKRMGNLDALSREFAREHSDRLWKQLVVTPSPGDETQQVARNEALVAFALASAAAIAIKLPDLFGVSMNTDADFYARNLSLFVLPFLTLYFVWKRKLFIGSLIWFGAVFIAAAVFINAYPFDEFSDTLVLAALHLPVALWAVVGAAYAGERWKEPAGRMDFVRFSGELFIYFVLIALGGGVLIAFMMMLFMAAGIDAQDFLQNWAIPCGAVGAVIVGSWLVEAKQSVIENMAPVLARIFTPLFAIALIAFLGVLIYTGRGLDIQRELLIAFDMLLVVVLGLLLYSVSARDAHAPAGIYDMLQIVLLLSALAADAVALSAIAARITEFGFTPNRIAALGLNVLLLIHLAWSAWLSIRFVRGQGGFAALERWQTTYLPIYAVWAATVVVIFPPVFGFL